MGNYDQFAQKYAKGTEELEEATRRYFYSLLPELTGKALLDVGCGSGHDAACYAAQGAAVSGVDISEKELAMAREKAAGVFVQAPMEQLPFAAGLFDIVTSFYAIQHAEDVPKTLLEMIRVAKPGGVIQVLAKHPFRNLLESHVNDGNSDYYSKRLVTSYIFNRSIKLTEQGHTMMDYLAPNVLRAARLELLEEMTDFPASEQVIPGLIYPTCMIVGYRKAG
ncbi:class I SAM-dependent methyltransferase [Candidatus Electronema sp. TJ]|uniref:class I SAM-dependent methyltransferase n=1 Tax=Candidatus Electronema sp. TJ TaxID=3401573 RepID=UPI003AA9301F